MASSQRLGLSVSWPNRSKEQRSGEGVSRNSGMKCSFKQFKVKQRRSQNNSCVVLILSASFQAIQEPGLVLMWYKGQPAFVPPTLSSSWFLKSMHINHSKKVNFLHFFVISRKPATRNIFYKHTIVLDVLLNVLMKSSLKEHMQPK